MNACSGISVEVLPDQGGWIYVLRVGDWWASSWFAELADARRIGMLRFYRHHARIEHMCLWSPSVRAWVDWHGNHPESWCV